MNYIVTKSTKSKGIAAVLVFLFGGIGLFYASITGGIIMGIIAPIAIYFFLFVGITTDTISVVGLVIAFCCLYYILCLIWALNAVGNYNKKLQAGAYSNNIISDHPSEHVPSYPANQNEVKRKSVIWIWLLAVLLIGSVTYILYYKRASSNSTGNKTQVFNIMPNDSISKKTIKANDKKKTADKRIDQAILNNPKTKGWKVENEERYLIFSSKNIYMIYNGDLVKTWHTAKSYTVNEYFVTETKEGDEFLDFGGFQINYKSGRNVYYDGENVPVISIYIKEKHLK